MNASKETNPLLLAGLFFVFFAAISSYDGGTTVNRGLRLAPNLAAILILLIGKNAQNCRYVLGLLSCILLSAICAFFYETSPFSELTLVFNVIAYIIAGFAVIPELGKLKAGWFLSLYFLVCVGLAIYFFFELSETSKEQYHTQVQYVMIHINNLGKIFLLVSAFLFVHQNPDKKSLTFLAFALVYALSETARGASYYSPERVDLFFYGVRVLYPLALAILLYYCHLMRTSEKAPLLRKKM